MIKYMRAVQSTVNLYYWCCFKGIVVALYHYRLMLCKIIHNISSWKRQATREGPQTGENYMTKRRPSTGKPVRFESLMLRAQSALVRYLATPPTQRSFFLYFCLLCFAFLVYSLLSLIVSSLLFLFSSRWILPLICRKAFSLIIYNLKSICHCSLI